MAKQASEHVLALFKAGVSAVPIIGGSVASLINDYVPTATQKSIDLAIKLLQERLSQIEDRIDIEAVNKDEFVELFKSCYLSIVRTHRENKLKAAIYILTNLLLKEGDQEKLSYTELDHFSRCVENLSSGAIEVLSVIFSIAKSQSKVDTLSESFRLNFGDLNNRFSDLSPYLLMGLVSELDAANLLHKGNTPTIATTNYGNYPIELTPLGTRFANFLLNE